jgi:uncharacterized damage-inducible protein DinB
LAIRFVNRGVMDATFRELLRGKKAHVDPVASLADIPAATAGRTVAGYPHSVWQIVGHMNYWMDYELRRIAGERPTYPERAVESWPTSVSPASDDEWRGERDRLAALIEKLADLSESSPAALEALVDSAHEPPGKPYSLEAVLWQTLVHNSYHAGQIALLLRCFGLWPPKSGSDSW